MKLIFKPKNQWRGLHISAIHALEPDPIELFEILDDAVRNLFPAVVIYTDDTQPYLDILLSHHESEIVEEVIVL